MVKIFEPSEGNDAQITIQREYLAIIDMELYSKTQHLWRGKILPHQQKTLGNTSPREWIYFSRDYQPDINDADKVFIELEFDDTLAGIPFTLVPFNKVRIFYTPESTIKIVTPTSTNIRQR